MKKKIGVICAVTAVVAAGILSTNFVQAEERTVIPDNITIGGVDVSGMTPEEAEAAVEESVANYESATFTLAVEDQSITASGEDIGLTWSNTQIVETALNYGNSGNLLSRYKNQKDLEENGKDFDLVFTVDTDTATAFLEAHASELNVEAVDTGLTRENGTFVVVEGQEGIEINVADSVTAIQTYLADSEWNGDDVTITLAAEITEPEGTAEELAKVQDLLGSYHTDFSSSSAARCANIENATGFINGSVVYPGEEFSVYDVIGPTDETNGYELAGAYENGTTVEAYGGGVCQVSSTLYNAVLYAELEVTQRSNHSMIVTYVDPARDAAIAGDYKNFKFVNNTDAPIYIEGYVSGKVVYFNIYGEETRDSNRTVTYESKIVAQEDRTYTFTASSDAIGYIANTQSAHIGKTAELWKIVTVDGVEESREKVNTSKYNGSAQAVTVGTGTDNPEAAAAMEAALATGDAYTIYSTIATYATDETSQANAAAKAQAVLAERAQTAAVNAAASGTSTTTETTTDTTTDTTTSETTDGV